MIPLDTRISPATPISPLQRSLVNSHLTDFQHPCIAASLRSTSQIKVAHIWHVRGSTLKIVDLFTSKHTIHHYNIGRIRSCKSVARYYTPPLELSSLLGQAKTPQR